jgi:hypothetical protein
MQMPVKGAITLAAEMILPLNLSLMEISLKRQPLQAAAVQYLRLLLP